MKVSSCVFTMIFMWICHLYHSDLSQLHLDLLSSSCVFDTSVNQSFHDIPVDLLKSLCVFVTSVVHICPHIHMDL